MYLTTADSECAVYEGEGFSSRRTGAFSHKIDVLLVW